jgi:hypothetical protein
MPCRYVPSTVVSPAWIAQAVAGVTGRSGG